jgi:hypothetical protein
MVQLEPLPGGVGELALPRYRHLRKEGAVVETILKLLLDEGKWLFASMLLSAVVVIWVTRRHRRVLSSRGQILLAMNLFWGCTIAMMAFGHLFGVTIKFAQGTLRGSWMLLYLLGIVLAVPAWWLVARAAHYVREEKRFANKLAMINGWLGITLLALGLPNLPLAVPPYGTSPISSTPGVRSAGPS